MPAWLPTAACYECTADTDVLTCSQCGHDLCADHAAGHEAECWPAPTGPVSRQLSNVFVINRAPLKEVPLA